MEDGVYEIGEEGLNYLGEKMTVEEYLQENQQEQNENEQGQNGMGFSL